jgi:plastocyanin
MPPMNAAFSAHTRRLPLLLLASALAVAGCATGEGPGWTFAPLGPTPAAVESPAQSPAGSPGGESPAGSPAGSPGESPAAGTTLEVVTPPEQPLAFVPDQLSATAATEVTVDYLNDSNIPHNIHFFAGPDASAESLGATEVVTGPGALQSITITTPDEPGQYFFHCDVHPQQMVGMLDVTP